MQTQPSKLIRAVTAFYRLVPQSLRFWWQVIRHGLVYGWLAALTAGLASATPLGAAAGGAAASATTDPTADPASPAESAAPARPQPAAHGAAWSFGFTLAVGALLMAVRLLAKAPQSTWLQVAVVALLVLVLLGSAFLATLAFVVAQADAPAAPAFAALALAIHHPGTTLGLVLCLTGCTLIGYLNPLVAVLLAPGTYLWLAKSLLIRTAGSRTLLAAKS